jgi:exopolysaccharide biosynthesis polyprenyl glycosylphosphotransferase
MMYLDALVVAVAFWAAYFLRTHFHTFYSFDLFPSKEVIGAPASLQQYIPVLFLWMLVWVFMLFLNGAYRSIRTKSLLEFVWIIIKAGLLSILAFGSLAFILKLHFVSRILVGIFLIVSFIFLVIEKWALISIIRSVLRRGYNLSRFLIVGTNGRAGRFINMIGKHPEWGFRIIGLVDDETKRVGKEFFGIKVIGVLADIPEILRTRVIDEVVFIVPRRWLERIHESIAVCETQGVRTHVAADLFNLNIAQTRMGELEGFPLLTFETTLGTEWQLFIKRAFDLVVSAVGLLVLSPFFLIVAVLIKLTSAGPVFFKQRRAGLNGRIFTFYKFRSMFKDAQEKLAEVKSLNEMDGPVFKIKDDPRITRLGRSLRKMSIDELPQLFNVLVGHMSLVGPRPPIPEEVEEYELWQRRRLSLRPGITCLWQVSGRSNIDFATWMELDLRYIDSWSLWLDFKILMKTIPVVLFEVGAE